MRTGPFADDYGPPLSVHRPGRGGGPPCARTIRRREQRAVNPLAARPRSQKAGKLALAVIGTKLPAADMLKLKALLKSTKETPASFARRAIARLLESELAARKDNSK